MTLQTLPPDALAQLREDCAAPQKQIRAVTSLLKVKDAAERLRKVTAALAGLLEPILTASPPEGPLQPPSAAGLPVPEHDRIAQGITGILEKLIEDVQSLTTRL